MNKIKDAVREQYSRVARQVLEQLKDEGEALPVVRSGSGCCGSAPDQACSTPAGGALAGLGYGEEAGALPAGAVQASRGCGNPTAIAALKPGQVVLDLGSGGGIDVFLAARRVGAAGRAIGLDMNDDMLALARANARRAGLANVEFIKGEMEAIPLPDRSVDVILSNCVINLSPDKGAALAEAFRVLKPGGRLAVSDMVFVGDVSALDPDLRRDLGAWAGCVAGALGVDEYRERLVAAGFTAVDVAVAREFGSTAAGCCGSAGSGSVALASAYITARRPPAARPLPDLRPATAADWPAIAALLAEAALPVAGAREHLDHFLTAWDGGTLVGTIGLEVYGAHGLLRSAAVALPWRGYGLGQALTAAILSQARSLGLQGVYLLTTTAAGYFPRFGFRPVSRAELPPELGASAELQGACPDSCPALALDLAAHSG